MIGVYIYFLVRIDYLINVKKKYMEDSHLKGQKNENLNRKLEKL